MEEASRGHLASLQRREGRGVTGQQDKQRKEKNERRKNRRKEDGKEGGKEGPNVAVSSCLKF